jgi:hypothetical protein
MSGLRLADVARVYVGQIGCMCGCQGRYSTDPRDIQRVVDALNEDPRTITEDKIRFREAVDLRGGKRVQVAHLHDGAQR